MNNVFADPANAGIRHRLTQQLFELKRKYDDRDADYPALYKITKEYSSTNYRSSPDPAQPDTN
jgi:hypothetical protein